MAAAVAARMALQIFMSFPDPIPVLQGELSKTRIDWKGLISTAYTGD